VRKGIKPEMYALSTLLFLAVLVLLVIINTTPEKKTSSAAITKVKNPRFPRVFVRKILPACLALILIGGGLFYGSKEKLSSDKQVVVYNWGEYLDPQVLNIFEKET
ncbi:MAG: spermidine/putrescine ABC transporter permease/substrate-binding protein PotCD, partial [Acetivibrio sp.]